MQHSIVCLLPIRNMADHVAGYISSVRSFSDAVVALDDGSTDDTAERLQSEPLVKVLLRHPRRQTYAGWNDSLNRNELLQTAGALEPKWIMSLDADERLDEADAASLKQFVKEAAEPDRAYGFYVCRIIGTQPLCYDSGIWVYRLFPWRAGQAFESRKRLHFTPIPTSIPKKRWLRMRLRIQHFASVTQELRQKRYHKYQQADSGNEYQDSYENLLEPPDIRRIKVWAPQNPKLPVLLDD